MAQTANISGLSSKLHIIRQTKVSSSTLFFLRQMVAMGMFVLNCTSAESCDVHFKSLKSAMAMKKYGTSFQDNYRVTDVTAALSQHDASL